MVHISQEHDWSSPNKPLMEEKRKETGNQPAASSTSVADTTPTKISETAPAAEAPPPRRRGGNKRKANGSASASQGSAAKRQAREKLSAASHAPIHNGPCTRARQPPSTVTVSAAPDVKDEVVTVKPECRSGDAVKVAEETTVVRENWEALEAKFEAEYEAIRSRDAGAHIVPIPAGWFSWTKVHPLEEQSLPSFFNGKSDKRTPEIYMEIRNWIMRKFHANPSTLIELKDLTEVPVGEPEVRQEVMEFLDHWGLINYHPFPDSDTTMVNRDDEEAAQKDSLVEKLYQFGSEQSSAPVVPKSNATTPAMRPGFLPESLIAEDLARPEGPDVEYHCNSCSADCSRKRYHNQKQADFDLCSECFNDRKFDSDMSPADFILMEPAEAAGVSGGKWTYQETLLLLEALELYKENWTEIAEHVATKTKAQCILHFIQMPIEDTFMESGDEVVASVKENADPATASNDSKAPKDAMPETTETTNGTDENQTESQPEPEPEPRPEPEPQPEPEPSPMEICMPEDASEKVTQEPIENCALKALKEAFEVVGCFTTPGTQLSFAEAGNPVMALAAFLVRLVEPNSTTALARSSLKSISGNSSSMQLAARHCFLLDEPPEDKKKSADSASAVEETVEMDTQKTEKQENMKDEKSDSVLRNGGDHNNKDNKDSSGEEKEPSNSNDGVCTEKSQPVKDSDVIVTQEEGLISLNETTNSDLLKEVTKAAKETDDVIAKTETVSSSAKEADDGTSAVIGTHEEGTLVSSNEHDNKDSQTIQAKSGNELDELTVREELPSSSLKESSEKASEERPSEDNEAKSGTAVAPDSVPTDNRVQGQLIMSKTDENEKEPGNKETEGGKTNNQEVEDASKTEAEQTIDKMKRAAATAISAAAVKAKLLADQEEEQIRQLAAMLIDKQLRKLETKLAFFNEMESVVMRVREQMERSKQRLYQERAQIIAARLGLPASSSRQMQQSLPINRVAMGFANSLAKSPMSMTPQRPPISRSMMTMGPPTSNTHVPTTAAGNPVKPTNKDNGSSVEMK